jgi:hypothetical protein
VHAKAFTELQGASFKFAAIAAPFSVPCMSLAVKDHLTIDTVCSHDSTVFTATRKIDLHNRCNFADLGPTQLNSRLVSSVRLASRNIALSAIPSRLHRTSSGATNFQIDRFE